jgi:hypothetical protein
MPPSALASPCAIYSSSKAAPDVPAGVWTAVEAAACAVFAVPAAELGRTTGGKAPVGFARQSAMHLAHLAFGMVEDRREDPRVDTTLPALENVLAHATSAAYRHFAS